METEPKAIAKSCQTACSCGQIDPSPDMIAAASRLLSAGESVQARTTSGAQEQIDVIHLNQDKSKFPSAATVEAVSKTGTFTARGK